MRTYLDCYACFPRQALDAARFVGADEATQATIMHEVLGLMQNFSPEQTPPEMSYEIQQLVRRHTGAVDPYRAAKQAGTAEALALVPQLRERLDASDDPLDTALRLAIAGNIIDLGVVQRYDLWATIERCLTQPFAVDDRPALHDALARAQHILYLGDNAGETVFDRLLIEQLPVPVTYVVKGGPTLNDATREDAIAAGLDRVATLIDNGMDATGTLLPRCSADFRVRYAAADLIIAKGQGNYETLSDTGDPRLFMLLQVKCPVLGRDLGAPVGALIVKQAGA